jgi:eukaryotic-like serine/threonine-protein kinase
MSNSRDQHLPRIENQNGHTKPETCEKQLLESIRNGEFFKELLMLVEKSGDLPVAPATFTLLTHLTSGAETSVSELSNIVLKDYGLTSKLLKLVNSVHFMRFGEVTTVSRAVILLGFQNIKNVVITMSLFENLQRSKASRFSSLLSRAIYAALMGEDIAKRMKHPNPEEAFLGSLFCCLGEIVAAYFTPDEYSTMQEILQGDTEVDGTEERRSLVIHFYRSVGIRVGRAWGLPAKMILCMKSIDSAEAVSRANDDVLHCLCSIANSVAHISEQEIGEELRQQRIERALSFYGMKYDIVRKHIHEVRTSCAEDLEKFCSVYSIDLRKTALGEGLFAQPPDTPDREEIIDDLESDFLALSTVPGGREESQNPEVIFADGLRDVSRVLLDNYNLDDVFTIIMETVYRGLRPAGVTKAFLLVRNTKKPVMDVRLALGESTAVLRKWFVVNLNDGQEDVFNISLNRQKEVLVKDSSMPVVQRVVPDWLLKSLPVPSFLLVLPIVVTGKAIGALYVEGPTEALSRIAPAHFHHLAVLRDQAVLAVRKKSES